MQRTLCLFPFLAVAQAPNPGSGVNFYSIERESALGRQLAPNSGETPIRSTAHRASLSQPQLGQRLAAQSGNPAFTYTFALITDDLTLTHEAAEVRRLTASTQTPPSLAK